MEGKRETGKCGTRLSWMENARLEKARPIKYGKLSKPELGVKLFSFFLIVVYSSVKRYNATGVAR